MPRTKVRGRNAVGSGLRMKRDFLVWALTTGAFCAFFAMFVATMTDGLALWQVMGFGGASGFLGSLLASFVWRGK
ncbi:MAG: hypothetical protein OXE82_08200, partial [Rhodobacter sp.]|nr:hypothetical protein [Rhodobacter sp.]